MMHHTHAKLTITANIVPAILAIVLLVGSIFFTLVFVVHAYHILAFPYPLDYGEGPLLNQVQLLREGTPIWRIYSDPAAPPYVIVNYPPTYLIATALLSMLTGDILLAGRLISLFATLGIIVALPMLTVPQGSNRLQRTVALLLAFLLLSIPIVREWAVLLRVDMLGVCLGIWGLVALQRRSYPLAALLLLLSLYTKPSLLAAPVAGIVWLFMQPWRSYPTATKTAPLPTASKRQPHWFPTLRPFLTLLLILGVGGGVLFGLLQWASEGWFALHVVAANANRWDSTLAKQFWLEQLALRVALILAAAIALFMHTYQHKQNPTEQNHNQNHDQGMLLAALYTLASLVAVIAVGKVGAFANYFLEWYVGLVWLLVAAMRRWGTAPYGISFGQWAGRVIVLLLVLVSFVPYTLFWSPTTLHRAGILEPNPVRLATAIRHDIQREPHILAALARIHTAILPIIANSTGGVVTDKPGVVAAAGRYSHLQAFEHRQLYDQGLWEQNRLLKALANGTIEVVVLEYLGNWLTPEFIAVVTQRYAQDGSLGVFDLYRPVVAGDPIPLTPTIPFMHNLTLAGYTLRTTTIHTSPPQATPGDTLIVTLHWQRPTATPTSHMLDTMTTTATPLFVKLQLTNGQGWVLAERVSPLFYGAFTPNDLESGEVVQHMHTLLLPPELPSGTFQVMVALHTGDDGGNKPIATHRLSPITIAGDDGLYVAQTQYYIPAPFVQAWHAGGGVAWAGLPVTPAMPFTWGNLQCFEYTCLEEREGQVVQRALGEHAYYAETPRSTRCLTGDETWQLGEPTPCPGFLPLWQQYGADLLGEPISGEVERNGFIVQWTRYARLERSFDGSYQGLGRLGDDIQRLPPGVRYRWQQ